MKKKTGAYITFAAIILAAMLFDFSGKGFSLRQDSTVTEIGSYTIDQLTKAVQENDVNLVNKIIKSKSVDINGKDSEDKYPIETVLVMGNCDMAKILLEAGADPYVTTSDGRTVYDIVMKGDNKYLKEIFREYKK
ncbi:ankyrin repeat domain-containing protein [Acidilutibacter cellobiosedens]|jgi:ankyrin repeat protein|uniref:Ankyrin repeat domain-containing protein n=1 Tax=Acidilutibacter cellobiosedens TaxID=2507161 RepID=A0A410Q8Z0_9FIRM|nr:ankyrin repeat domain-containing protein [Acidilutibacter cellobiosedens]MBE6083325.1 ankyrin repeat domain-containing protein [Tissierellaceae bacterium]QAT60452.1 ankyrin repeat domain-containing protein [Acidilutibacter cellobiosedens]